MAETTTAVAGVDTADYERQIAELKEQSAEHQRTAEFWAERAKTGATAPAQPVAAPPEEDDPDVLEAITTGGAKGFDALAEKRGFIKRTDVEQLIDSKAARATKEFELIGRYPDLKNKNSDFFKATAGHYGDLVKGGTPQALAMELAAEKAELDFMRSGKIKSNADLTKEEKETRRLERIAAQSGETGGRRAAASEADDDELSPDQKRIADAMGVSHDAYLKRAKAGVKMGGGPR